jgi:adenylate cyclase
MTSSNANKASGLQRFSFLVSASAVGLYITVSLSALAFYYYQARQNPQELRHVFKVLHDVDQKSIDYRLLFRGPRPADPRVAVLAVDDRSIDLVGRWPWPRETLARALTAAFENGAKVIAADVVWSEPTDRPELRFAQALSTQVGLPQEKVNELLIESDNDRQLSEFITKYKSQFVLGSFFESPYQAHENPVPVRATPCIDLVYKNTLFQQLVDSQEKPFIITDDREINFNEKLSAAYEHLLSDIGASMMPENFASLSYIEQSQIQDKITHAKLNFCSGGFLNPAEDEVAKNLSANWQALAGEIFDGNPPAPSFDEWITFLDQNSLRNAIPETLFWTMNIPLLTANGSNNGYFNAKQDTDGTIRRAQLLVRTGSRYVPSIALLAYLSAIQGNAELEISQLPKNLSQRGIKTFKINNEEGEHISTVPTSTDGFLTINYAGRGHTIPHASIADLLNPTKSTILVRQNKKGLDGKWANTETEIDKKDFFKDKIFVLGATAIAVFDLRVTSFDENFPGVETHANVVDNLLRKDFLFNSAEEDLQMPLAMLALGTVLSFSISYSGALVGLLLSLFCAIALAFVDRYFLFSQGVVVSIAFPLSQTLLTYMALTFFKYLTEERSKKELRQTFSKYVSPQIVEEVLRDPKNLELGGRKEKITVFFSDVRGFTTISEKLNPLELSDLLNSYLTPMTDLVFSNKGTLDKYMGDAIMAFFGAPLHMEDHAKWACRCALQHLEKLEQLKKEYIAKGLPEIDIGIGLNTGECSVGNMGSQTVRNYTVMGDTVNLASRLEGINKQYGTRIIISEFTYAEVKDSFTARPIDRVQVKGKKLPVEIYELVCEGRPSPEKQAPLDAFQKGYELYSQRNFTAALEQFKIAHTAQLADPTAEMYIERCEAYIATPPPADWDGVFIMTTK